MGDFDCKVPIVLDRERHLLFSLDAMRKFEGETGINLLKGFDATLLNADLAAKLLWACLVHEDKELTVDNVAVMVHVGNLQQVIEKLGQAMAPKEEAEDSLPFGSSSGQ